MTHDDLQKEVEELRAQLLKLKNNRTGHHSQAVKSIKRATACSTSKLKNALKDKGIPHRLTDKDLRKGLVVPIAIASTFVLGVLVGRSLSK
jgi:F0F1-type ATP synthase assembly protein I